MTKQERIMRIAEIEEELKGLPKGKVFYKNIKGKQQPYLQWSEDGKAVTKYVKLGEREEVFHLLEQRKQLIEEMEKLKESRDDSPNAAEDIDFRTNVIIGAALNDQISSVRRYQKRDCYGKLQTYIRSETAGKVCILYGLRRTGKTTLLFQVLNDLTEAERSKAVYVKARVTDHLADLSADLKQLRALGFKYALLDEVTLMEDFIDCASILSDIYAMQGMKIILSGTDSLGFWMAAGNELYDRAYMIHTTYIPFREYSRLLGIDDIDEYIRYGGTLMPGETDFDDPDALDETAAFRDDETTRRYIDTAVCKNIQHSLACFQNGNYFRHLRELYEANELTSAINRIIESMNHQQLFDAVNREGGLMIQAHPFRLRGYINAIHLHPREVHGVEVYNGGNSPDQNELALHYAQLYNFPMTSGSDIHNTGFALEEKTEGKMNVGGMEFESPLTSVQDFIEKIKNKEGRIIR